MKELPGLEEVETCANIEAKGADVLMEATEGATDEILQCATAATTAN